MKRKRHILIYIPCILGAIVLKFILDIFTAVLFSIRLGYWFDLIAIALGAMLARHLILKFETKRNDQTAKLFAETVPESIVEKCKGFKGNSNILRNYLDVCLSNGEITQDQYQSLYRLYSELN